jgi:hypothetical protein
LFELAADREQPLVALRAGERAPKGDVRTVEAKDAVRPGELGLEDMLEGAK